MRVRIDRGALVAQAVLSGVLVFAMIGNGSTAADVGDRPPGIDPYVVRAVVGSLTYLALFIPGHLALRWREVSDRWAYAGLGAACALAAITFQTPLPGWDILVERGVLALFFAQALGFGAILGFLYAWRAGLEAAGDDPARLEAALKRDGEGVVAEDGAFVDIGDTEYFAGPLQVRTLPVLAFVAALISAGAFALLRMAFGLPWEMAQQRIYAAPMAWEQSVGLAVKAQLFNLPLALMSTLPFAGLVLLGHAILRGLGKSSYKAYAAAGVLLPFLAILVLGPMGALMGLMAMVPMAISMCVYRNMAGVEPKSVKEDIRVRDRRALVGDAHPRRRYGRLVKG